MKVSESCKQLIRDFEGLETVSYKPLPTEKHFTIGYGHYGPDVKEGQHITKDAAELLLTADLAKVAKQVEEALDGVQVNQCQFDALCSFTFNLGIGNLSKSTLLKKIKEGDFQAAADEFLKWDRAGGQKLKGLTLRRQAERRLFLAELD